jgi:hypothetical protein
MKTALFIVAAIATAALSAPNASSASPRLPAPYPAGRVYEARYFLTGSLLRASLACVDVDIKTNSGFKAAVAIAFAPVSSPELIAFSKSYPKTIAAWMGGGASAFNREVMAKGLPFACQDALQTSAKAAALFR